MSPVLFMIAALGAPNPVLVLTPVGLSPGSEAAREPLKRRLIRAAQAVGVPTREAHGPPPTPAVGRAVDRAIAAAEARGSPQKVRSILQDVLTREETPDAERITRLLQLARVEQRLGLPSPQAKTLLEACFVDPGCAPAPGDAPGFVAALERAKAEVRALPRGRLRVDGPPGATLSLDGRSFGVLPIELIELPQGEHRLRAEKNGVSWRQTVKVQGGQVQTLRLDPQTPEAWLAVGQVRSEQLAHWSTEAGGVGVPRVLISAIEGPTAEPRVALFLLDRASGRVARLGAAPVEDQAGQQRILSQLRQPAAGLTVTARPFALGGVAAGTWTKASAISGEVELAVVTPAPPPPDRDEGSSWWIWAAGGAVLVGAGVGAYLWLGQGDDPAAPPLQVRW